LEGWEIPNTPTSIPNLKSARSAAASDLVDAQVESVNIVGYMTQTLNTKNTMVGLNFGTVGTGDAMAIQDVIPGTQPGLNKGATSAVADNISVLGDAGYTTYYLSNGVFGKITNPDANGKWVKSGETVATTDTIPVGGAFWFISQTAATTPVAVTIAGQVAADATLSKQIKAGLNMIASGFAYDIVLNAEGTGLNVGTKGATSAVADNISVLNGTAYSVYYLSNGVFGKITNPDVNGKWVKSGETAATPDAIPAGASAWYINRGAEFAWNQARPYAL
jgi:hypothetical protein